ncbi:replication factor C large subunit [Candidatus Woesearchaeota archaeon]|nr:replication factor C large subunit [Candidatus Woesearchaeota archaeon]
MVSLISKYSPKSTKEIAGQERAVEQLVDFINHYDKQRKKAILLYGPSGSGKTSSVYAGAKELGLEVFEINASDFRNKEQIKQKLGSAINQRSLFAKNKIILIDEIDGLSGTKDRGSIPEIIRIMKKSRFPIVLTVANPYDKKFSSLRQKSIMVEFKPVGLKESADLLNKIAEAENLKIRESAVRHIARREAGDIRAMINDLEILSSADEITIESLEDVGMREKEESIIDALVKILKTTDPKTAIGAFDYVNEDLDQKLLWIDENLPKEYDKAADLKRAYRNLSDADIFRRRIRRWQHWRFLVYINALITAGVAVSKDKKYNKYVQYRPTGRILKMWWAKRKAMKKKAIAEKLGSYTHSSSREVLPSIPYLQLIFRKDREMAGRIAEQLELDKEEVEWLGK